MTRQDMIDLLRKGFCCVLFTKADGSQREMYCTLAKEYIPEDKVPNGNSTAKENLEIIRVFDTEINEWRSFKIDKVISFRAVA